MPKPPAPAGLKAKSARLWKWATETYELRGDELRVLEDACREIDLVERMEAELRGGDLVVRGSMGQPVASPLVQELRQHRATVARLLAQLKLPDEPATPATGAGAPAADGERSSAARQAAEARWRR